jgi:hypothetical protein
MHGNNTSNLLYGYFYLKLAKSPCFSYCLLCFFFFKIGEQEGNRFCPKWHWWGGGRTWWQGKRQEDEYGANDVSVYVNAII